MSSFLENLRKRSQESAKAAPAPVAPSNEAAPTPAANPAGPSGESGVQVPVVSAGVSDSPQPVPADNVPAVSAGPRFSWQRPSVPAPVTEPAVDTPSQAAAVDTIRTTDDAQAVATTQPANEITGPAGFKAKLDAYDKMVGHLTHIDPVMHGVVKSSVKALMIDLQSSPEMRELIIDRDIHNIMLFIQSSTRTADSHFEGVAVKREKKAASATQKSQFGSALDALLLSTGKMAPTTLDQMATMDADSIKSKTSR